MKIGKRNKPRCDMMCRPGLLYLMACLVALIACQNVMANPAKITDQDISAAIDTELFYDDAVMANEVNVTVTEGIVTLTGTVDTLFTKDRSEELASAIVGVRAVINRIEVNPSVELTDEELEKRVRQAFMWDPVTEDFELQVHVANGVASLEGTVESFAEKRLASTVAKDVAGVAGVENRIRVEYDTDRMDSEIEADVIARLENDILVDDYLIDVSVKNGTVELTGEVGSLQEQNRAYVDAWVAGTQTVKTDDLEIKWWARDTMRRKGIVMDRSNEQVEEAVNDAFLYDPRVISMAIGIHAMNGTVTLNGTVENLRAKHAAEEDARNTLGVWRVVNNLKVRPEIPENAELERRVAQALHNDSLVNRFDIQVLARHGWVTLKGDVDTSYQKHRAELVSHAVKGVVGVLNKLNYERIWIWKPDRELRADIKDQLYWSVFTDADDINVSIDKGTVTLSGTVSSWNEYNDAEKNAYQAGARHVINNLEVEIPSYEGPYGPLYYNPYYMGGYPVPYPNAPIGGRTWSW